MQCLCPNFNTAKGTAVLTWASSILSTLENMQGPSSCPEMSHVLLFCLSIKFFFYFSPFTSSFANPPPAYHVTNPFYNSLHFSGLLQTTGLPEIGSLCVCISEIERRLLYFMPITHKDHGPLQFGLVNRSWRGNRRMFVESGQRMFDESGQIPPPGRRKGREGGETSEMFMQKWHNYFYKV